MLMPFVDCRKYVAMPINQRRHLISALLLVVLSFANCPIFADDTFVSSEGVRYRVERFLRAEFPVGMTFTPAGELLYTEKATGNVRLVDADGRRQRAPVLNVEVNALQERGMQNIALDPDFENNERVWVFYTAAGTAKAYPANKVMRFRVEDGRAYDQIEMLAVPIDSGFLVHNGGGLQFDDDGYLYIGIGDYGDASRPQDLGMPHGKIHRFAVSGDRLIVPDDNPFADSSIFAYGLRNPFDYAFDPVSGRLFATENGDNCDDEINMILPGFNYGYREDYECAGRQYIVGLGKYLPPLVSYTPTIAPVGITFYQGDAFPIWRNDLFFCSWNDGQLHHLRLSDGRNRVLFDQPLELGAVTCRIDITVSPGGALYFGTIDDEGGAIYRLVAVVD